MIAEIAALPGKWRVGETQLPLKYALLCGDELHLPPGKPTAAGMAGFVRQLSCVCLGARSSQAERPDQMEAAQQHLLGPQKMKKFLMTGQKTSIIIPLESYELNTKVKYS